MAVHSAGLLLFRTVAGTIEVLLVHPGGPFWRTRDEGAWSIPKGEVGTGEDPFHAALREFREETGQSVAGEFIPLAPRRQAGGKTVHAWAVRSDFDPSRLESNTFEMEWPPRSGRRQTFPEIDRAAWLPLDVARIKILKGQWASSMSWRRYCANTEGERDVVKDAGSAHASSTEWLLANARPAPDFTYCSKRTAIRSVRNSIITSRLQGFHRAVDRFWPAL